MGQKYGALSVYWEHLSNDTWLVTKKGCNDYGRDDKRYSFKTLQEAHVFLIGELANEIYREKSSVEGA